MNFLAIDPSINNIGFAILQTDNFGKLKSISDRTFNTDAEDSLMQKCVKAFNYINEFNKGKKNWTGIGQLILEYPQFMVADRGIIAAQKGYTLDLAMICGFFASAFSCGEFDTFFYTPIQWKGTKPKGATLAQYKRIMGRNPWDEHSCDAAMLGYHHLRTMKYLKNPKI